MRKLSLALGLFFCASPLWSQTSGATLREVAVLPFIPIDGSDPGDGWSISLKLIPRLNSRLSVRAVNWKTLNQLMEKNKLDKKRLRETAFLREIGRLLGVDGVVTGEFSTRGRYLIARPQIIHCQTGEVARGPELQIARDLIAPPPARPSAEPSVVEEDDSLALGDFRGESGALVRNRT